MKLSLDRHGEAPPTVGPHQRGSNVFDKESGLLQGTVELLVLKTLSWGPMHGYGIASWIESVTSDALRVEEGSLYPALYRMAGKGWISAEWGLFENNRRAKFYALTRSGRARLAQETALWRRVSRAIQLVLRTA